MGQFRLKLPGAAKVGEELIAEIVRLPPVTSQESFVGSGITSRGCLIGVEKILREGKVVGEASFAAYSREFERESWADGLAGADVAEEGRSRPFRKDVGDLGRVRAAKASRCARAVNTGQLVVVGGWLEPLRWPLGKTCSCCAERLFRWGGGGEGSFVKKRIVGVGGRVDRAHRRGARGV